MALFPSDPTATAPEVQLAGLIYHLLELLGEDPAREGLQDTPLRVARAWQAWTSGYATDPARHLKVFADGAEAYDQMVVVHNIPVVSHCEHHLAPFTGVAHVAYLPSGRVVGLSKLARVVDGYARRLQVQERLTQQVATCLHTSPVQPRGVAVLLQCTHACMASRGVKVHGNLTTTSAMVGAFREDAALRQEFLTSVTLAERGR